MILAYVTTLGAHLPIPSFNNQLDIGQCLKLCSTPSTRVTSEAKFVADELRLHAADVIAVVKMQKTSHFQAGEQMGFAAYEF